MENYVNSGGGGLDLFFFLSFPGEGLTLPLWSSRGRN